MYRQKHFHCTINAQNKTKYNVNKSLKEEKFELLQHPSPIACVSAITKLLRSVGDVVLIKKDYKDRT